jgi:hypothetical protein
MQGFRGEWGKEEDANDSREPRRWEGETGSGLGRAGGGENNQAALIEAVYVIGPVVDLGGWEVAGGGALGQRHWPIVCSCIDHPGQAPPCTTRKSRYRELREITRIQLCNIKMTGDTSKAMRDRIEHWFDRMEIMENRIKRKKEWNMNSAA